MGKLIIPETTMNLFKEALQRLSDFFASLQTSPQVSNSVPSVAVTRQTTETLAPAPRPAPKPVYDWSTPEAARHSLRVICDEEGLTVEQKNLMSQVVHCESGYHTGALHPNLYNGKQVSCDYGICQWNDKYHGGEITPDEATHNPEKAVRLMCQYVKRGQIKLWVCYSGGLYKQYTA